MLQGKRIAIFGGTSGIGRAVANAAGSFGAEVVMVGRRELSGHDEQVQSIDVRDESAVAGFFAGQTTFDHVISTVGVPSRRMDIQEVLREEIDDQFAVKYWGQFYILKHAVKGIAPGGSVVLTTGIPSGRPVAGYAMHASICAALEALVRTYAVELAPMRINAISPGNIESKKLFSELSAEAAASRVMSERATAGLLQHAVQSYLFALTNAHFTGQILTVDGGGFLA